MRDTVGDFLDFLEPSLVSKKPPSWPPDLFGIATYLLTVSGGYLEVLRNWPPREPDGFCLEPEAMEWAEFVRSMGTSWRAQIGRMKRGSPSGKYRDAQVRLEYLWGIVQKHGATRISRVGESRDLSCALLQLAALADEASYGAGIAKGGTWGGGEVDRFQYLSQIRLVGQGSLCSDLIDTSRLRVLPKLHTPLPGISPRSLSHHLSLWTARDVVPLWFNAPLLNLAEKEGFPREALNLLLLPWPDHVSPSQFCETPGTVSNMDVNQFGFFTFRGDAQGVVQRIEDAFTASSRVADRIHGVVLPELALHENEYSKVRELVMKKGAFLIAGVGRPASGGSPGANRVEISVPWRDQGSTGGAGDPLWMEAHQDKHHRWMLDGSQIQQYHLASQLHPARRWWENIELKNRHLVFVSAAPWLTFCALICEDLARQDPTGRLIRSVGPNLVFALLMDGPQLPVRWPKRYATVLAEDPGCSVLTLTSLGMCLASRPRNLPSSRTVGLWKDAVQTEPRPIELPEGANAIVLNLIAERRGEWTADGRVGKGASFLTMAGSHPLRC